MTEQPDSAVTITDETTDTVETTDTARPSLWQSFNRFRRTRPFMGSIILALGGYYVTSPVLGSFGMLTELGTSGAIVYLLGGGMIAAALIAFFAPKQRFFPAIMAALFSVASLPLANLGGWILGMTLGIIGSGMIFAWTPYTDAELEKDAEKARRRAERKALKAQQA